MPSNLRASSTLRAVVRTLIAKASNIKVKRLFFLAQEAATTVDSANRLKTVNLPRGVDSQEQGLQSIEMKSTQILASHGARIGPTL
jgi:hypothetical protein